MSGKSAKRQSICIPFTLCSLSAFTQRRDYPIAATNKECDAGKLNNAAAVSVNRLFL